MTTATPTKTTRRVLIGIDPRNGGLDALANDKPAKTSVIVTTSSRSADEVAEANNEDTILVVVPKFFNFTDDKHTVFPYQPGTYRMPRSHATSWYAKVNGVKAVD